MDMRTFEVVCRKIRELSGSCKICLSGGEPLLHPQFFEFLDLAIEAAKPSGSAIQISTNGVLVESALRLLKYAWEGKIEARLSLTPWHNTEMIAEEVLKAFSRPHPNVESREGFFGLFAVSATGRAASWGDRRCYWEDLVIDPNGDVFPCGCRKERIGSIFDRENILLKQGGCVRFEPLASWKGKKVESVMAALPGELMFRLYTEMISLKSRGISVSPETSPAFGEYLEMVKSSLELKGGASRGEEDLH